VFAADSAAVVHVFLIRHALAFERDARRWPDDRQRPLTAEGRKKFRKGAGGLARLAGEVECVVTSPLVRAQQTAEILASVAGWPRAIEAPQLAPGQGVEQALALIRARRAGSIALVGHEPGLSRLAAVGISGADARASIALKKGGAACLEFDRVVRAGGAQLLWLVTPKLLRALA
jgi:phosphohistidine phosphatase